MPSDNKHFDFHLGFGFQQGTDTTEFYAATTVSTCSKVHSVMNGGASNTNEYIGCFSNKNGRPSSNTNKNSVEECRLLRTGQEFIAMEYGGQCWNNWGTRHTDGRAKLADSKCEAGGGGNPGKDATGQRMGGGHAAAIYKKAAPRCCEPYDWNTNKKCTLKSAGAQSASVCPTWGGLWVLTAAPAVVTAKKKNTKQIYGCFLNNGELRVSTNQEHKYNCGSHNHRKKCFCLQPCNTGKYGSYDHKDCQSCVAGRYSDKTGLVKSTDALPCAICPKGYWQDEAGSTSCKVW